MKIWVLSDLHCSLAELADIVEDAPEHDVLVLAGDLAGGLDSQIRAIDAVSQRPVVIVAGNHEYWHRILPIEIAAAEVAAMRSRRVRFLERSSCVVKGVRFVGGTLWSDFLLFGSDAKSLSMAWAQANNADFRSILAQERSPLSLGPAPSFSPEDARRMHFETKKVIDEVLSQPFDGPSVVVSHHAPSMRSVASRWREDAGSPGYASDLDGMIERLKPDLWIHGHLHEAADYEIGRTRVLSNPKGFNDENPLFDRHLVVEI